MTLFQLTILAIVQGVTEFLPVSSSGHLVLAPEILNWPDQGLIIDVAVHVGSLLAVLLYFWRDVWGLFMAVVKGLMGKKHPQQKLLGYLILATLPIVGAGYLFNIVWMKGLRGPEVVAWATLGFGMLLYMADKAGLTVRRVEHMDRNGALFIGLAQILALIPGTSRSGITITAARILGFERRDAARFSMLLAIPTIIAAGALKGMELYEKHDPILTHDAIMAAGLAFITAFVSICVMMAWLRRATYTPFVLYRIALAAVLLIWIYQPFGWQIF